MLLSVRLRRRSPCEVTWGDTGRRRRWSEEEKLKIVLESFRGPRQVAATARRYGLCFALLVTLTVDGPLDLEESIEPADHLGPTRSA